MKQDERGTVVELKGKVIPRDAKGDPAFTQLGCESYVEETKNFEQALGFEVSNISPTISGGSLLEQFEPAEIVEMVNRYIYQTEYQRTAHRRRARAEAEVFKEVKAKLKELFGVDFAAASEDQLEAATKAIHAQRKKG